MTVLVDSELDDASARYAAAELETWDQQRRSATGPAVPLELTEDQRAGTQ